MELSCTKYGLVLLESRAFKTNNLACAIYGAILALPVTLFNISLIAALLTIKERSKPCYVLLINVAITDLLAGLVNFPFNSVIFYKISISEDPCSYANISVPISYTLGFATFLSITAIALERFVSIFYPFFHEANFHAKTLTVIVSMIWLTSVAVVLPTVITSESKYLKAGTACIGTAGCVVNIICYTKVLLLARRIRREIDATAARFGQQGISNRDKNLAKLGCLIVISICACYFPIVCSSIVYLLGYKNITFLQYSLCWEWALANTSALTNPIITCTLIAALRQRIKKLWACQMQEIKLQTITVDGSL